jgi:ADP-ribose pyrophosphatase
MRLFEKTIESEKLYDGKIITLKKDKVVLENDTIAYREVIMHPGGVCVLPLTSENEIIMVKQFRYPFSDVILEVPAGKLNYGEDHFECGKRELLEETGAVAKQYDYLGEVYPTPAYLDEIIHLYLARDLEFLEQNLDDDEFLEVVKMPFEKAVEMVMNNEIKDSKSQVAILKTAFILQNQKD